MLSSSYISLCHTNTVFFYPILYHLILSIWFCSTRILEINMNTQDSDQSTKRILHSKLDSNTTEERNENETPGEETSDDVVVGLNVARDPSSKESSIILASQVDGQGYYCESACISFLRPFVRRWGQQGHTNASHTRARNTGHNFHHTSKPSCI